MKHMLVAADSEIKNRHKETCPLSPEVLALLVPSLIYITETVTRNTRGESDSGGDSDSND